MKHRCPWCGEIVSIWAPSFMSSYRCPMCGNNYKPYRKTLLFFCLLIIYLSVLGVCFSIDLIYNSLEPFWVIIWLFCARFIEIFCTVQKDTNKFVQQQLFHVEISSIQNSFMNDFRRRFIFIENQIFTVCFVDKKGQPISNMICVSTENIKWNKNGCKCVISYLPLGKNNKEFPSGTNFYMFHNNKKIAKGILKDSIENMEMY